MSVPGHGRSEPDGLQPSWLLSGIDQAADLIFITDTRDRFVYVNRKCIDLLGTPPTELIGDTVVAIIAPECHAMILDALRAARLEEPPETQVFECAFVAKHGEGPIPVEVALQPVTSRRKVLGCIGIARSLSIRRDNLDERLASERVAAIADLASRAADRINNPLAVLVTHLGVIEREAGERTPADAESIEQMRNALDRIAEVTKDLTTIADTSIQKFVLGRSIVDIRGGPDAPAENAEEGEA